MTEPGPAGPIMVQLTRIEMAARDINLYRLQRPDGAALPAWSAGSHIELALTDGIVRHYSLVDGDGDPAHYWIAVKRDPASRGGSLFLHDQARVGQIFAISPPRNNFPLAEDASHTILIAGGIGITPILAMAHRLDRLGRPWRLVYAARSRLDAAFHQDLTRHECVAFHFDDERQGPLDLGFLDTAPPGSHLYCCGPAAMIAAFERATAGRFAPDQLHVEYFSAREEAATEGGFTIELARSGRSLAVPPGETILDVLEAAGLDVPNSCREGVCGSCETAVIEGVPDHRDAILSPQERAAGRTIMICCSGSKTPRLVLDL